MESTGVATSTWVNIKLFVIPRLGGIVQICYFAAFIWLILMTTIGGAYIFIPGLKDIMDETHISNYLISAVIRDKMNENEFSSTYIFIRYICIKHLILFGIILFIRHIVFGYFMGI